MKNNLAKAAAIVGAGALLLSACGSGADGGSGGADELRVGVVLSLTGPAAPFGLPERDVVELLADQVNEDGGVNGRKVALFIEDDKTNPTEAAKAVRKLIADHKVHAIVGATVGSATLAAAPIAAGSKVPMVAPNGTISITDPKNDFADWVFRSSMNDALGIDKALANAHTAGHDDVGVIYQQDAYGESSLERAREVADKTDGMKIVETGAAPVTATDLSAQATKVVRANPDVVLIQASAPSFGAAAARALKQSRYDGLVIVAAGLTQESFISAAGDAAEGIESTGAIGWDKPTEGQQALINLLKSSGKGEPKGFGEAIGGGAFNAVVAAAESVKGDMTGEAIRDAMESACFESYLHGPEVCFGADDHDGFTVENGANVRVTDGTWVTVQ